MLENLFSMVLFLVSILKCYFPEKLVGIKKMLILIVALNKITWG